MQRNFEPMRKQVEGRQRTELTDVTAKVVIYEAFRRGQTRSAQTPCPHSPRSLLRAEVRGIPAMDNLEPFQCVHIGVQGTRSHPAIQGDSQAGSIPGGPVLTVAL